MIIEYTKIHATTEDLKATRTVSDALSMLFRKIALNIESPYEEGDEEDKEGEEQNE